MTGRGAVFPLMVNVSVRSVSTVEPSLARWWISKSSASHMATNIVITPMAASIPSAGAIGMLWYTTSSAKKPRNTSASLALAAAQKSRTTCSALGIALLPSVAAHPRYSTVGHDGGGDDLGQAGGGARAHAARTEGGHQVIRVEGNHGRRRLLPRGGRGRVVRGRARDRDGSRPRRCGDHTRAGGGALRPRH